jgi:hypothetical protein
MASCGMASKDFEMSSCVRTSPWRDLVRRRISLGECILLKHPGSDTNSFCLGENVVLALRLWSMIPQYIRHIIGLILSGREFSFCLDPCLVSGLILFCFVSNSLAVHE